MVDECASVYARWAVRYVPLARDRRCVHNLSMCLTGTDFPFALVHSNSFVFASLVSVALISRVMVQFTRNVEPVTGSTFRFCPICPFSACSRTIRHVRPALCSRIFGTAFVEVMSGSPSKHMSSCTVPRSCASPAALCVSCLELAMRRAPAVCYCFRFSRVGGSRLESLQENWATREFGSNVVERRCAGAHLFQHP